MTLYLCVCNGGNMAFIQKIYQLRKNNKNTANSRSKPDLKNEWKTPKIDQSDIRLVLFSDNDIDRQLIFDSKAVKKADESQTQSSFQRIHCHRREKGLKGSPKCSSGSSPCMKSSPKYQLTNPGSDVKMLEGVMFGSPGMAYKGTSLKLHFLGPRNQMLLTKVFIPEVPKRESLGSEIDSDSCSLPSHTDLTSPKQISQNDGSRPNIAQSVPVDVPSPQDTTITKFDIYDSGLASLTSSGSFQNPFPSPGSTPGSYSSLHRRWMRVASTSLEGCLRKRNSQDNLQAQDSSSSSGGSCRHKKSKIGLGILFGLCDKEKENENHLLFQNFFFSHIALFEGHLERLKVGVEKAYYTRRKFVHIVMEALETFQKDVIDLYTTPRLSEPVWLNMMTLPCYRYQLCESFMKELMSLVGKYDNKNTHFFMSTLVTAVLTHHLAWVPTVTPAGGTPSKTYLHNHSAKWLDTLAKTHPYNPLWAQLGDLYGAIGYPLKLARTIVVGKKADIVKKILYILSYFIRCSDVQENSDLACLESLLDTINLDSPTDERVDITPIQESLDIHQVLGLPNGKESHSGVQSDKNPLIQENTVRAGLSSSFSQPALTTDSMESSLEMSQERVTLRVSKKNQSNCDRDVRKSVCDTSGDEGYCSIVHSDDGYKPCRLSSENVRENVPKENVQNVSRSAVRSQDWSTQIVTGNNELSPPSDSVKGKSMLSEQITSSNSDSKQNEKKKSTAEIRAAYLKEGSHSIFNEYFDDASITAKTIDEVDEKDRVIHHPLVHSQKLAQSISINEDSVSEASGSFSSQSELQGIHDTRLGSFGQGFRPRISSVSRQLSSDRGRPTSLPGRCRSVTPTELNKRRHLSSTSSFDFDLMDPLLHFKDIEMPDICSEERVSSIKMFDRNFGRSLLAGFSDHYLPDFVLHGTSDANFQEKLLKDLQMATQHSVLDEPIGEAVFVIADTDKWTVEIASSQFLDRVTSTTQPVVASQLVCNMMEGVLQLWKLKMSPEFCSMHLEDRLQEIYFKSKMLAEYVKDVKKCDMKELTQLLGFDSGDLPLLFAIAGTHSPHLSFSVV